MQTATYNAAGGNPGGHISATGSSATPFDFSAPAPFLGNQSSSLGGTLSFDLGDVGQSGFATGTAELILVGASEAIYFGANDSPTSNYKSYSYSMGGSGAFVNCNGGNSATFNDFAVVLANLQAIYICGSQTFGTSTASRDNVSLPEPATLAMLATSTISMLRRRRVAR